MPSGEQSTRRIQAGAGAEQADGQAGERLNQKGHRRKDDGKSRAQRSRAIIGAHYASRHATWPRRLTATATVTARRAMTMMTVRQARHKRGAVRTGAEIMLAASIHVERDTTKYRWWWWGIVAAKMMTLSL